MPIKVTKKPKESSVDLAKRFSKTVKKSGVLLEMRKKAFFIRKKSDNMRKRSALRKIKLKETFLLKRKLGKI